MLLPGASGIVIVSSGAAIQGSPLSGGYAGAKRMRAAAAAYGAAQGISANEVMGRFDAPLHVENVADAIVAALRGEIASGMTAVGVSGKGIEVLA